MAKRLSPERRRALREHKQRVMAAKAALDVVTDRIGHVRGSFDHPLAGLSGSSKGLAKGLVYDQRPVYAQHKRRKATAEGTSVARADVPHITFPEQVREPASVLPIPRPLKKVRGGTMRAAKKSWSLDGFKVND